MNARRTSSLAALIAGASILLLPVAAVAKADVPLKGSDAGGFSLGASCGATSLVVDIEGVGHATQIGRYSYEAVECFDIESLDYTGQFTMTAANGDELRGEYAGHVYPIEGTSAARYLQAGSITDGTGRFSGAIGSLTIDGVATFTSASSGDYTQRVWASLSKAGD
jgi:hypothetical protein